jgi:thiol reductant ABC exporter CydC subunit
MRRSSALETLSAILRIASPPRRRFSLSLLAGTAAALSTVGLMACSGSLIDHAALRPPLYTLGVLMATVQIFALCRGPARYSERIFAHDSALEAVGKLRLWLYDEIEPRSPAGLSQWRRGDLLSRATADVDSLQDLALRGVSPVVIGVTTSLGAVVLATVILPVAGLVLACGSGGAICLASLLAWRRQRGSGTKQAELDGLLAADVVELFSGMPDLLAFGRDQEYLDRALAHDEALTRLARRRSWTAGAISAITIAFTAASVAVLLVVSVPAMDAHRLPGYMIAVLPLVAMSTFEVVTPIADAVSRLSHHLAASRRVLAIAELPIPVTDPPEPEPEPLGSDLSLQDARLRYGPDHPWALDGLTMSVPQGHRVALVGPSGAGKSSVVNVLLRFWALESGQAAIGGVSLERLSQDAPRRKIAWVAQDTHLFNTTLGGNIALARPDASDEEIRQATRAAQLEGWIDSLVQGLNTVVGEQGAQLSGGQRQRVALARALLARSPILLLDEPTSGLDEPTAQRLLEDVLSVTAGKTMVYITHRNDELAAFDEINVVEDGRISQRTTPPVP